MRKNFDGPTGDVHTLWIEGTSLSGNLLGDPARRRVDVYVPPGRDDNVPLPLLVDLVGYTSGGPAHTSWKNYGENVPERLDRLIGTGAMPPVVVAFPDCFTRLGGNQYIDSLATGAWEGFLINDMLPAVEARFACGGDGRRGVFGKSSGGFGALVHAMRHGGSVWSAAASHSGDAGFDCLYHLGEFAGVLRHLVDHDMSVEAFCRAFEAGPKAKDTDWHTMMILAQAATFDPDPDAFYGIRLPVDMRTCEIIPERWANWTKWDPLRMADEAQHLAALRRLKLLYFDCGDIDQFNMVYGSRRLHDTLESAGIAHVYEEFHDNHSSVDYRMDVSLPLLAKALS
ncbi:alpha/beta hydrolase [Microvirga antarctica]|uniref:alpha/beta hydrolase n=1 Tax=Microvirga antarctica TaxID=2819233 RepID=UPI001B30DFA7|nr:alpha/beta hydrolase-fold protein [Microvirga antarctica]